jgi:hypothetical protein
MPGEELKPVTALAPPLDQTPTFPTTVLVGTLVTVEPARTAKSPAVPSIGAAHTWAVPHNVPSTANVSIDKRFVFILCGLEKFLNLFM